MEMSISTGKENLL
ncbi:unnamed protein product [Acanthoscelides obtectus]|uniref:Uncharacterized protein n=1 Tax=Acanthoscelides obtectus TaxID=200917 RepID=A0A9P0QEN3_ACAOB|nr:unnamed protein product [Acanthoscelides obtectus]